MNWVVDYVVIAPTYKCNLKCGHCAFDCGPERTGEIPFNQIHYYINQVPTVKNQILQLTGGEFFLYKNCNKVIEEAGRVREETGYPKRIIAYTNGSWAKDVEKTGKLLRKLKESGLDNLYVSNSAYHQEVNDPKTIEILRGFEHDTRVPEIIINEHVKVEDYNIAPIGRGKKLKDRWEDDPDPCSLFEMIPDHYNEEKSNRMVLITPDGMSQCCYGKWKIGELGETISSAVERTMNDPLKHVLGTYGVGKALRKLEAAGCETGLNLDSNVCLLCEEILSDSALEEKLRKHSKHVLRNIVEEHRKMVLEDKDILDAETVSNYLEFYNFQESLTV